MENPITPLDPTDTQIAENKVVKQGYAHKELVALDQFINVTADGTPDETISSRMARWATNKRGIKNKIGVAVSTFLNWFQKDHGAKAEASDAGRAKNVEEIEEKSGNIS